MSGSSSNTLYLNIETEPLTESGVWLTRIAGERGNCLVSTLLSSTLLPSYWHYQVFQECGESKLRSLYLCGWHFTNGAISLAPKKVCLNELKGLACIMATLTVLWETLQRKYLFQSLRNYPLKPGPEYCLWAQRRGRLGRDVETRINSGHPKTRSTMLPVVTERGQIGKRSWDWNPQWAPVAMLTFPVAGIQLWMWPHLEYTVVSLCSPLLLRSQGLSFTSH